MSCGTIPEPRKPSSARPARLRPNGFWRRSGLFKDLGAKTCRKLPFAAAGVGASDRPGARQTSVLLGENKTRTMSSKMSRRAML
jgi:hypothetical protein